MTVLNGEQTLMLAGVAIAWVNEGNEGRPEVLARCASWSINHMLSRQSFETLRGAVDAFLDLANEAIREGDGVIARWSDGYAGW